jgi:hypothetical protein
MNREQQERIEDLGRNIVNAIIDVIDSDFQPQERVEMVEPSINQDFTDCPIPSEYVVNNAECGDLLGEQPVRNTRAAYEPVITQVNNGFTVRCGCQTFVFETFEKMSKYLQMYFENPAETEEKFYKNELFK